MACGCSKKKKRLPVTEAGGSALGTRGLVSDTRSLSTNRMIGVQESVSIVEARCSNCMGLLVANDGRYLPMHTGEYYEVTTIDVTRWRSQGYFIEVKR